MNLYRIDGQFLKKNRNLEAYIKNSIRKYVQERKIYQNPTFYNNSGKTYGKNTKIEIRQKIDLYMISRI